MSMRLTASIGLVAVSVACASAQRTPEGELSAAGEAVARSRTELERRLERLSDADRQLQKMRSKVTEAREELVDAERDEQKATRKLDKAREAVRDAEAELRAKQDRVAAGATDDAIFGLVRSQLQADDELRQAAIAVEVSAGTVTLRGRVPDGKLRDRALAIARGVPGVRAVESDLGGL